MDTKPPEYIPATQLADECGMGTDRGLRSLRQWLHRNHREALTRRSHPDGGERLMVGADAAEAAREHFGGSGLAASPETAEPAETAASTASPEATGVRESASPASTEPAVLALAEAKGRAEALLEAAVDRALRAEAGLDAALRRVGELERAVGREEGVVSLCPAAQHVIADPIVPLLPQQVRDARQVRVAQQSLQVGRPEAVLVFGLTQVRSLPSRFPKAIHDQLHVRAVVLGEPLLPLYAHASAIRIPLAETLKIW